MFSYRDIVLENNRAQIFALSGSMHYVFSAIVYIAIALFILGPTSLLHANPNLLNPPQILIFIFRFSQRFSLFHSCLNFTVLVCLSGWIQLLLI
jgi:hypothetical protein